MSKEKRICLLGLAFALAAALPSMTGVAGMAVTEDAPVIARVENYLNSITTLRASFLQVAPDGSVSEGMLYLARPGRLRVEYDPPASVVMVGNGSRLTYYDRELGQVSELPLTSTLARILIRKRINIGDDLGVLVVERAAGVLRITLAEKDDPGAGLVTLVFNSNPLGLRQWSIKDAQGLETRITLMETWFGLPIDASLFDPPGPLSRGAGGQ